MILSTPLLKYVESKLPADHGGQLCVVANASFYIVFWQLSPNTVQHFVCSISVGQLVHKQYEIAIGAQVVKFVAFMFGNRLRLFNSLDVAIEAFKTM